MELLERKAARDKVKACTSCGLRSRCSSPVPFSGPSRPRLVVVGEAPTQAEDEAGTAFVGKSGDLARNWLSMSGWNVDEEVAFVQAVACYPNRTPTKDEISACQTNLHEQLDYLECDRLLVFGGISVAALCNTQVRIGEARGLWWRVDRIALRRPTWALATWHPTAVLRNDALGDEAYDDVGYASLMVQRELEPTRGSFCVKCGDPRVDYSSDIPYCSKHLPKG